MTFRLLLFFLILSGACLIHAQSTDDCLICHDDPELTGEKDGREVSMNVNPESFAKSVHGDLECVDCHTDLEGVEDFPHDEELAEVDCSECHDDISSLYSQSLHGQAVAAGVKLAPRCWDCHGSHDIMEKTSDKSRVAKFNIPFMCGRCHREGSPVTKTYDIPQDSILSHYSLSIHGEGLFKQGLTVTAVCSDCHTAHFVLPHTDPRSTIYRDNVSETCRKCHGQIEQVHKKVIHGELWEKEPNKIPVCVDCHEPHKIRKVFYGEISNEECLVCHRDPNIKMIRDGQEISLYVDTLDIQNSDHRKITCAQCHTGVNPEMKRPCTTVTIKVDCSICHSDVVDTYASSTHGQLADRGDRNAPVCEDCHGTHNIRDRQDPLSPSFPINVPKLCAKCHREGNPAAQRYTGTQHNIVKNYIMSIHGKGLLESGLIVTAMCTDCHTAHHVLPADNPASSVNRENIARTCARCHSGIYEKFVRSVHSKEYSGTEKELPNCDDCHQAHVIRRTDEAGFKFEIMDQCGRCHKEISEAYFETIHGKVSKLGYEAAAKCYDCHGAHDILPPDNVDSHLSHKNIVQTCGKCHKGSHRQFAGYLTHATHHDRSKYPILFYAFWFMAFLLVGTMTVAGTHTVLWLPRSVREMKRLKSLRQQYRSKMMFQRFKPYQRRLHVLVIISFIGLVLTGMTLKFSYLGWAQFLSHIMGGFGTASYIHRICAVITFFYFFTHIFFLFREKGAAHKTWRQYLFDDDSMLPNKNDVREAKATIKWFFGRGPRPEYGRWTYWEKFDYFAVFWGVAIIGTTGLMLWFPEFFTLFLPGFIINVATIIHSDEALLAAAFIFTIHFFNTHLRPGKFPMDTVIFTGRMPVEELKEERPREYRQLVRNKKLAKRLVLPLPPAIIRGMRVFGAMALIMGIGLILLIVYAEIFGYR